MVSTSDPAPGTSPENLHSLVLVLSSACSGSTMLCNDIDSLGGLGTPKEYLRGLRSRTSIPTEADVLERVAMGVREDAPGVGSVELLVPQIPPTYEALSGKRILAGDALPGVIDWAKERFERLFVVFLVRNAIDQAISTVLEEATGEEIPNINQKILANMGRVVRERRIVLEGYRQFADVGLLLTYDELVLDPVQTSTRLVSHADKHGFEVKRGVIERKQEDVTSPERFVEIRESFLDYLKNETGVPVGG